MASAPESSVTFIQGRTKGSRNAIYGGYRYTKDGDLTNGCTSWRCVIRGCKGRLHTRGDNVVAIKGEHIHEPNVEECNVKIITNEMKQQARDTRTAPAEIIAKTQGKYPKSTRAHMPPKSAMTKMIHHERHQADSRPRAPSSLSDISLVGDDCLSMAGESMLLHDVEHPDHRMIFFGTKENVQKLEQSDSWYVDSTYFTCPQLFSQLLTIHAEFPSNIPDDDNTWVFPCIWVLMGGKKEAMYLDMCAHLTSMGSFNPLHIMSDFEVALRNALGQYFPTCQFSGCYFHFSDAVTRKVMKKQKEEYEQVYTIDNVYTCSPLKIWVRRLIGLAFVPADKVEEAFAYLVTQIPEDIQIYEVLTYFQNTWVAGQTVAGVTLKPASFPPVLWNVRGRTLERMNRTNNPVESFHSQFKKFVKTAHPTIWAFIDAMRLQQSDTDGKICSMIVGERPPKRKKTHLARDDKIFSATNQFDNMELIPYLDLVMNL